MSSPLLRRHAASARATPRPTRPRNTQIAHFGMPDAPAGPTVRATAGAIGIRTTVIRTAAVRRGRGRRELAHASMLGAEASARTPGAERRKDAGSRASARTPGAERGRPGASVPAEPAGATIVASDATPVLPPCVCRTRGGNGHLPLRRAGGVARPVDRRARSTRATTCAPATPSGCVPRWAGRSTIAACTRPHRSLSPSDSAAGWPKRPPPRPAYAMRS